jgi:hypothetical protein
MVPVVPAAGAVLALVAALVLSAGRVMPLHSSMENV